MPQFMTCTSELAHHSFCSNQGTANFPTVQTHTNTATCARWLGITSNHVNLPDKGHKVPGSVYHYTNLLLWLRVSKQHISFVYVFIFALQIHCYSLQTTRKKVGGRMHSRPGRVHIRCIITPPGATFETNLDPIQNWSYARKKTTVTKAISGLISFYT